MHQHIARSRRDTVVDVRIECSLESLPRAEGILLLAKRSARLLEVEKHFPGSYGLQQPDFLLAKRIIHPGYRVPTAASRSPPVLPSLLAACSARTKKSTAGCRYPRASTYKGPCRRGSW